ncbi:DUF4384 domain-containing protein [Roseospira navarrensis]|uniref:DUF4384 domain-containing protein n=1 Tax=Roseospira navarrensis TaxID=140058 RepID=A0A7X1ZBW7_9PROT|nr:DUF4384 domain-containing protein [Roseospira navarrensis]MQX35714.1 DUF4384 domain-containing protein [Roseospira navarrensis]
MAPGRATDTTPLRAAILWVVALILSVVVHGGVIGLVMGLVSPAPVEAPDEPPSALRVATQTVERGRAAPAEDTHQRSEAEALGGERLTAGAVPRTRADAAQPDAARVASVSPSREPVTPADPSDAVVAALVPAARPVPPASVAAGPAMSAIPSPARVAMPARPASTVLGGEAPAATVPMAPVREDARVVAATTPPVESARPADTGSQPLAAAAPVATDLAGRTASAPTVAAEPLPARPAAAARAASVAVAASEAPDARTPGVIPAAALAGRVPARAPPAAAVTPTPPAQLASVTAAGSSWEIGGAEALDPQALASIQTFLAPYPGAVRAASGASVRDRLTRTLAAAPCSRLEASLDPGTGDLTVRGHVPNDAVRADIQARVAAIVGEAFGVRADVLLLPEPQCAVLARLDALPMAQSADQADTPLTVGAAAHAGIRRFRDGETLTLTVESPDFPAWIHMDYFDSGGQVIHLTPGPLAPYRFEDPARTFTFGDPADVGSGPRLTIAPPFGQEVVLVFGTSRPLEIAPDRPTVEPAAPYLERLGRRLDAMHARHPDFRAEWGYLFVETLPADG